MRVSSLRGLLLLWLAFAGLAVSQPMARAIAQQPVDLELVLAVDVSLSMDLDEQRLQRDGYIKAFRDRDLIAAILAGRHKRIAVTYMEWAGSFNQQTVVPWVLIDSAAAAEAFAVELERQPISRFRMTSISGALSYAGRQFGKGGYEGMRRVIDVSGDGPNNSGPPVADVRDGLVKDGIVINGLPILLKSGTPSGFFDIAELDTYYADCVIGGDGAFLIPVTTREEFATATRRKLILEISGTMPQPAVIPAQFVMRTSGNTDCLVGEKQWQRYMGDRMSP